MPEKHFYFSVGAVVGSAVCVWVAKKRHALRKSSVFFQWLYRKEPNWFLYFPAVIFLVSLWGLIPDFIHAFGLMSKEQTRTGIFDIFFFHTTFEHIENTNPTMDYYLNVLGELLLVVICLGVMAYYVLQIKKAVRRYQKGCR
ncbi:hypothetical protein AB835_10390 [Candidatus Endobugula sertula]|uniref:Uncharacterized protein n=1 Tax=Candidatus Endobugula sertula TaxID=62101 RepID=A0A1D2QNH2_9GAMM|nr:hypothetical protein AB835_10390 [Candidatus Endobugula sertula]